MEGLMFTISAAIDPSGFTMRAVSVGTEGSATTSHTGEFVPAGLNLRHVLFEQRPLLRAHRLITHLLFSVGRGLRMAEAI